MKNSGGSRESLKKEHLDSWLMALVMGGIGILLFGHEVYAAPPGEAPRPTRPTATDDAMVGEPTEGAENENRGGGKKLDSKSEKVKKEAKNTGETAGDGDDGSAKPRPTRESVSGRGRDSRDRQPIVSRGGKDGEDSGYLRHRKHRHHIMSHRRSKRRYPLGIWRKKHRKGDFRLNDPLSWIQFRPVLEMGFLGVAKHNIQFGKGTTRFDYLKDGGQDNLFFFWRIMARLVLFKNHHIKFLYQPLNLKTNSKLRRDVRIDTVDFPTGTPVNSRYGFDFYRASYLYQFLNRWGLQMRVGAGLQIRNAKITFTSADGALRFDTGNIGPVPVLSFETRYNINDKFWLETEIDGFYAWLKFVNGGDDPIVGAILDASLRAGFNLNHFIETFVNVRYVGGGARGSSEDETIPSDGFTNNWIHLITVSLGLGIK